MKRIKSVNGYTIYQATTQRDADNYSCEIGHYNIYISQDIRDFGLTNSYPEYDNIDTLVEALNICLASQFAIACALADELSDSTIQDMDLCLELERRLDAGDAINTIRQCYDRENGILYESISDAIDHGFDPYADDEFDPYEDHPAMAYDEDGKLHVVEDECEWDDDDVLDGDLPVPDEDTATVYLRGLYEIAPQAHIFIVTRDEELHVLTRHEYTGDKADGEKFVWRVTPASYPMFKNVLEVEII